MLQSKIVDWNKYVSEAVVVCNPQFSFILEDYGITDVDATDILTRCFNRYVLYLKLIHHRVKRYFTEMWALHGISNQFSIKEAKWLLEILSKRTTAIIDLKGMQEILLWTAFRYNFWLGQQFYK